MASRVYSTIILSAEKLIPSLNKSKLWQHAAGPKTVFFWAPLFKWGLVIAGLSDLQRPVEQLSLGQSSALAATGIIWSRYSLVIIPKNYSLFAVNLFVGLTQLVQVGRVINHMNSKKEEA